MVSEEIEYRNPSQVFIASPSLVMRVGLMALVNRCAPRLAVAGAADDIGRAAGLLVSNADLLILDLSELDDPDEIRARARQALDVCGKRLVILVSYDNLDFNDVSAVDRELLVVDYRAMHSELLRAIDPEGVAGLEEGEQAASAGKGLVKRAPRAEVEMPVRCGTEPAITRNISTTGIFLEVTRTSHQVGDELLVEIDLDTPEGPSIVTYRSRVVRRESASGKVRLALKVIEQTVAPAA